MAGFRLKDYQQQALDTLRQYCRLCVQFDNAGTAFYHLTSRPYNDIAELPGLPYVCLRLPTGAGKTFVACHALPIAMRELLQAERSLVLWLVPSNAIRAQTLAALKDRRHPYRQALDSHLGSVAVMDVSEALYLSHPTLSAASVVIVSTIQAFRVEDTEGRKVYESNGALMDHFSAYPPAALQGLESYENGGVKYSLANLLRLRRPIVIVDEAHNARTQLSFDTLARFDPACIIELTATPDTETSPSNVLHQVSAAELKAEDMIKLPIVLETSSHWKELLAAAIAQLDHLEALACRERQHSGEYLRPVMLLQAQPRRRGQETLTVEVVEKTLIEDFRTPKNQIARATGEDRDLEGVDIADPDCPLRFVITVQALKEGWDCPFAYVLCSVAELHSPTAVEQILGRVMRLPGARRKQEADLNQAYAFVASNSFVAAAEKLRDGLVQNGFERIEAERLVRASEQLVLSSDYGPLFREAASAEAQYVAGQPSPAERGTRFSIPVLALRQGDLLQPFEETHLIDPAWRLSQQDPTLSEREYAIRRAEVQRAVIDIGAQRTLQVRFITELHQHMRLLTSDQDWSTADLVYWLDHNIPHPDIPMQESRPFITALVRGLQAQRGLSLAELVHDKYRLRQTVAAKIDQRRQEARNRTYQQFLLATSPLEVTPDLCFEYDPHRYPCKPYRGAYAFHNHYYPQVGDFDSKEEEECAVFIDALVDVETWVRNPDRGSLAFWLQTATDKFYPDFVCKLRDGRILVVEYKGADRWSNDDSREKRTIGEVWERQSQGRCLFVMPRGKDFDAIRARLARSQ